MAEVTTQRVNSRNGYWAREWDTWAGTKKLAIPKLRHETYFPSFLEHRRCTEAALASVVATSCLLGLDPANGEACRLPGHHGPVEVAGSTIAGELVEQFRSRPLDAGPYTLVWTGALIQKVREGGRTVNMHCLITTRVNAAGFREIPGVDVTSSEDGTGWSAFLRGLVARGLSGVALVTSDDHAGLVSAIGSALPRWHGSAAARMATANLLTKVPKDRPAVGLYPGSHYLRTA